MKRQAPIAAAAVYAHPVEHFLTGILSTSAGLLIMTPQLPVYWLWYCWIGFQVQNDHSGYHLPLMFSPEFHDYHHLKYVFIGSFIGCICISQYFAESYVVSMQ